MQKILNIPDIRQSNDSNCGVSVVQAILGYYGEDWNESELANELQPYSLEEGVPRQNITKFFKNNGYKIWSGKMQIEHLILCIDKQRPVILLIQAWSKEKNINWEKTVEFGHYVVVCGYNDTGLIFEEPALLGSKGFLTFDELEERWHGLDGEFLQNYGIIIFGEPQSPVGKLYHIDEDKGGKKVIRCSDGSYHVNEEEDERLPVVDRCYDTVSEITNDVENYLHEYFDIKENNFKLKGKYTAYVIGPDGRIFQLEGDNHGHVLSAYPEIEQKCMRELKYKTYRDLSNDSSVGSDRLYKWMYENQFVRGTGNILAFLTLNNKQKDSIINLIEHNKDYFKTLSVDNYGDESYKSYDMKDFFRKFLM